MRNLEIKRLITNTIKSLEETGDIVITTSTPSVITERIYDAIKDINLLDLTQTELDAISNCVHTIYSGFRIDGWDFQTHIGLTKEELKETHEKMNVTQRTKKTN